MGVATLHRQFNIAAPRLHAERVRQGLRPSAGSALPPRDLPLRARSRVISRWLRDSLARSQRMSFASLSPALSTAADGDAMSLADHERTRAALGRVHRAVRADLSTAGRSRSQGELRDS